MIGCPREGGRIGRALGLVYFRPGLDPQEGVRSAQRRRQLDGASEMTRRVFAYGWLEGFQAAAESHAAKTKEMKEQP